MVHFDARRMMVRTYHCVRCRRDQESFHPRASERYAAPVCIPCARDLGYLARMARNEPWHGRRDKARARIG